MRVFLNRKLNQIERIIVAIVYIIIMLLIFKFMGKDIQKVLNFGEDTSIWFYSGAFLIILGSYLTEPFFSKPTDTPFTILLIKVLVNP